MSNGDQYDLEDGMSEHVGGGVNRGLHNEKVEESGKESANEEQNKRKMEKYLDDVFAVIGVNFLSKKSLKLNEYTDPKKIEWCRGLIKALNLTWPHGDWRTACDQADSLRKLLRDNQDEYVTKLVEMKFS